MTTPFRYDPRLAEALQRAAESYRRRDDDGTGHWLTEAARIAPWRTDIRFCLAGRHIQHGVPELAVEEYDRVLARIPADADALVFSAHWHRFLGNASLARERMTFLSRVRPSAATSLEMVWSHIDSWLQRPVSDAVPAPASRSKRPGILLLGLLLNDDGTPRPALIARLEKTLEIIRRNPDAPVVVSGGMPRSNTVEATVMREWLQDRGIAGEKIFEDGYSRDIVENLIFSREILAEQNVDAVFAVTCAVNIRRTGVGLDILSDFYGLGWETTVTAASGATFASFIDDGRDGLKLYRDSLRTFGIPMMASYPFLAER